MELGEKLRQARMEAGLSQRQLCGGEITRNMLSLIENGSARPSMDTLKYLSHRLGKPVSFFLDENALTSPNQSVMASARRLFDAGEFAGAVSALEGYRSPDAVYDREMQLLMTLCHLELAKAAIDEGKEPYALELLQKADRDCPYCGTELKRQRLLLLGRIRGQRVSEQLPGLDEELLLRAAEALDSGKTHRAARLLEAAEDQTAEKWNLLRGRVYMAEGNYPEAARCLHMAEGKRPGETAALLEECYRELGDFKRAYEYACRQK